MSQAHATGTTRGASSINSAKNSAGNDEAVMIEDDDDDDMADLFSFDNTTTTTTTTATVVDAPADVVRCDQITEAGSPQNREDRAFSTDSLLEMLDHHTATNNNNATTIMGGSETDDILAWLDEDDDINDHDLDTPTLLAAPDQHDGTAATSPEQFNEDNFTNILTDSDVEDGVVMVSHATATTTTVPLATPTVVAFLPPVFTRLEEALQSEEATVSQIQALQGQWHDDMNDDDDDAGRRRWRQQQRLLLRPALYCKLLCQGRSPVQLAQSSLASAYPAMDDVPVMESSQQTWLRQQAERLAESWQLNDAAAFTKLLLYLQQSQQQTNDADHNSDTDDDDHDVLLPAVAATLLSVPLAPPVAALVMAQGLVPQCLPLLRLTPSERQAVAASTLHAHWKLVATYHVPTLVTMLDRHVPRWYQPRDRTHRNGGHSVGGGLMPMSWLMTWMAGEDDDGSNSTALDRQRVILPLWDRLLTCDRPLATVMPYYLTLAAVEAQADTILAAADATGMQQALQQAFVNCPLHHVDAWWQRAEDLHATTPTSVTAPLTKLQDDAFAAAIQTRQAHAERALQQRLDREAAEHAQAEATRQQAARVKLNRARLVAFYREHAPDKESNIDMIWAKYHDKLEELDHKLKIKYGVGFEPSVVKKAQLDTSSSKLLATMNTGFGSRPRTTNEAPLDTGSTLITDSSPEEAKAKQDQVAVSVSVDEVLPVLCWSKEAAAARGAQRKLSSRVVMSAGVSRHRRPALRYYLVDSREEDAATEQGRFPTAVQLSPEALLDPDRIKQQEEIFESLRGAVHIVVMGEGFSALPRLYGQNLNAKLKELMLQDESRTNICALFFIKNGFPFVSVLDGGFAAAHSWLVREGLNNHLTASEVLVDYNPNASMFGQMEVMRNASSAERAQRHMTNLLENSLVAVTRRAQMLERMASDAEDRPRNPLGWRPAFGRKPSPASEAVEHCETPDGKAADTASGTAMPNESSKISFRNPFARKNGDNEDGNSTVVQSIEAEVHPAEQASMASSPSPIGASEVLSSQSPAATASSPSKPLFNNVFRPKLGGDNAVANPFKGLGAALQMSKATDAVSATTTSPTSPATSHDNGASNSLLRNPFARFGGGGGSSISTSKPANEEGVAPGNHNTAINAFAGLNSLRKSTLQRLQQRPVPSQDEADNNNGGDESISFTDATAHVNRV